MSMTNRERWLLSLLADSEGYVACDGEDRPIAHSLDKQGFAEWKGTSFGSSFWAITDKGRKALDDWG